LPFNCGKSTCGCGEDKGDGSSNVEEERVGDFKEEVMRLVNVLRNADGEFVKTDVVEGSTSGDNSADLGLDHGPENENLDLRLDLEASNLGLIFDFFILKGFTYSAR